MNLPTAGEAFAALFDWLVFLFVIVLGIGGAVALVGGLVVMVAIVLQVFE